MKPAAVPSLLAESLLVPHEDPSDPETRAPPERQGVTDHFGRKWISRNLQLGS